jgi:hypothetical protein
MEAMEAIMSQGLFVIKKKCFARDSAKKKFTYHLTYPLLLLLLDISSVAGC